LINSKVTRNFAIGGAQSGAGYAGGVLAMGNLYMLGSTIAGNTADIAAGLAITQYNVAANILNSTISGNRSVAEFAGVLTIANTTIANSTIAFNVSSTISNEIGIYACNGSLDLQSSTIAMNTSLNGLGDLNANSAVAISGANNVVTQSAVTMPTVSTCPRLGRLADNGCRTPAHALLPGSPAIDAGNNKTGEGGSAFVNDQRGPGYPRLYGAASQLIKNWSLNSVCWT
jgi:hypothetical protein